LHQADAFDTVLVYKGVYKEGNIEITKPIFLLGKEYPIIDGDFKNELISVRSSHVVIKGFQLQNSGYAIMKDPAAIKVYKQKNVRIENNRLMNNYFSIYFEYSSSCVVSNNFIKAQRKAENRAGNGIHCWYCDSMQIIGNKIFNQRDGIYFEFVTHSIIWRNIVKNNQRYGLHFMFSHHNAYITNYFKNNGSGVAVMFTKKVTMINNTFENSWGGSAYGLLFKELSDCYLNGNKFIKNTTGVLFDGTSRIIAEKNSFKENGWGMRIQANCIDNYIIHNNFLGNTFDVATNGSLTLNHFNENYWDKYDGYDLNKDGIGDVPYRPLSLFAVITEKNPPAMLLYRSFIVSLMDKSEKILPSITPESFIDNHPMTSPF
jgi:nitrous oxidase accessory protein